MLLLLTIQVLLACVVSISALRDWRYAGMKKGIDISYWQDNVDLQKAKQNGVQFVILREGYRKTIDKKFLENVQKAKEAGLPVLFTILFIQMGQRQ